MEAVSFILFAALCDAGNTIARQREQFDPGSDAWIALTAFLQTVDGLVDAIVLDDAIEVPEHA